MTTVLHRAIPADDGHSILASVLAAAEAAGEAMGVAGFRALAHAPGETITLGTLAMVHGQLGDADTARHYSAEALRRCEAVGNTRGIAFNLDNFGQAHRAACDHERAIDCYQRAIASLEDTDDSEVEGLSWYHLGQVHSHLRDFPKAIRAFRRAIEINPTAGNPRWGAILLADLATTLADAGHPAIARTIWHTALTILTELADPRAQEIRAALAALPST